MKLNLYKGGKLCFEFLFKYCHGNNTQQDASLVLAERIVDILIKYS
jgi:hypothetical protein